MPAKVIVIIILQNVNVSNQLILYENLHNIILNDILKGWGKPRQVQWTFLNSENGLDSVNWL